MGIAKASDVLDRARKWRAMARLNGRSLWAGPHGRLVKSSDLAAWYTRFALADAKLSEQLALYTQEHRLLDGEPDYYAVYVVD